MTKTPKVSLDLKSEMALDAEFERDEDQFGINKGNRKTNYKNQKPILEKRRRDRINNSLDELKSLLLAIKQRDPLRYARLEKADILEMVVKHLKDVKKRRQALVVAMEPILYRNFKMGYIDCTKATIEFINESKIKKKQQIIEHVTQQCIETFESHAPTSKFNQHFQTSLGNNPSSQPVSLLSTLYDSEQEWPSLEDRLRFTPAPNSTFFLSKLDSIPPLLKFAEPLMVNSTLNDTDLASKASTSSETNETLRQSISMEVDTSDDKDDRKLIIDDPNNNQTAWRPWL